jgi:hypothetical protein
MPFGTTEWQVQTAYKVGSQVKYDGKTYERIQVNPSHDPGWTPPSTPALWKLLGDRPDPDPHPELPTAAYLAAATFAAVGLHNESTTNVRMRPAPAEALADAEAGWSQWHSTCGCNSNHCCWTSDRATNRPIAKHNWDAVQ